MTNDIAVIILVALNLMEVVIIYLLVVRVMAFQTWSIRRHAMVETNVDFLFYCVGKEKPVK